jgi:quinol-cytochrome oxidoreductase complex cytochrome b subunit
MQNKTVDDQIEHTDEIFYPSFLFKEIFVMMLIFILVAIILAIFFPVGLGDPADPTDTLFVPKPEWYFLSLYELLKFFPGKLEFVATAIIPAGGIILLILLPFIDKGTERRPNKRPIAITVLILSVSAIIVLTIIGLMGH